MVDNDDCSECSTSSADSSCSINSFQAIAPLTAHKKRGHFFKVEFLHQKLTPKSYIETRYKLFQKHVPSY
jgi:hypothetical protein